MSRKISSIFERSVLSRISALTTALWLILALTVIPAAAEEEEMKPVFTRVAAWDVKRAHWDDFVEFMKERNRPVMEQLLADGVISEFGIDAESLHSPDGYSHSTWFSTNSMADMDKVFAAWKQADDKSDEPAQQAQNAMFDEMVVKHADFLMRTEYQRARKATVEGGYFQSAKFRVKMGKGKDYLSYYNHRIKPVYEQLLAAGDVVAFGRSEEEIVTGMPGAQFVWYVVEDGAGLDKVRAAFDAHWGEMDEEGRRARWTSIMDFVEEGSFRESLTHISYLQIAAQ
jgi:hypothetical protein